VQQLNGPKFRPTLKSRALIFTVDPARNTAAPTGTLMIGPSNSHLASLSVPKKSRATLDLGSER
jgi:hypothetical protein